MSVVAPCDAQEMRRLVAQTLDWPNPIYFRVAKGGEPTVSRADLSCTFGKAIPVREGGDLLLITTGVMLQEALAAAAPYLLEPFSRVAIDTPGTATSRVTSFLASRRGQMLGIAPKEGWSRWDVIEMLLPGAELHGLDGELRSLSQGMAHFEARFDHYAEVNGKLASSIIQNRLEAA